MKNNYSSDYLIYLNHSNNAGGTPIEKWEKVQNSIMEPMVLMPLLVGIVSVPFIFLTNNPSINTLLLITSSIGIGLGINYFIYYYNKQTEYQILKFKAETTVRNVNLAIKSLLRKNNVSNEDRTTIDILTNTIDFWKDYHPTNDPAKTEILKKLRDEIKDEKHEEARHEKLTVFTKVETETRQNSNGANSLH